MREDVVITSSYLSGEEPLRSERYDVHGIECKDVRGEFDYCFGLQEAWMTDKIVVNVEHDMEFSDELVDGLVNCPWPLCAYAYQVWPTALQRWIYCATSKKTNGLLSWLNKGDEWAYWSSIGFCKVAPSARAKPLDLIFWQYLEHSVNRAVGKYGDGKGAGLDWHIHWNEGIGIEHYHDYHGEPGVPIPDHLW